MYGGLYTEKPTSLFKSSYTCRRKRPSTAYRNGGLVTLRGAHSQLNLMFSVRPLSSGRLGHASVLARTFVAQLNLVLVSRLEWQTGRPRRDSHTISPSLVDPCRSWALGHLRDSHPSSPFHPMQIKSSPPCWRTAPVPSDGQRLSIAILHPPLP
jgi:hypothetical protein